MSFQPSKPNPSRRGCHARACPTIHDDRQVPASISRRRESLGIGLRRTGDDGPAAPSSSGALPATLSRPSRLNCGAPAASLSDQTSASRSTSTTTDYPMSRCCATRSVEVVESERAHCPEVLFEVFSPSTADIHGGTKLIKYCRFRSVGLVAHVDPVRETVELYKCTGERQRRDSFIQPAARTSLACSSR